MRPRPSAAVSSSWPAWPRWPAARGRGARGVGPGERRLTVHRGSFRQRLILSGELAAEPRRDPGGAAHQLLPAPDPLDGRGRRPGQGRRPGDRASTTPPSPRTWRRSGSPPPRPAATSKPPGPAEDRPLRAAVRRPEGPLRALEKAKIAAAVPKDILSLREYQERQLALKQRRDRARQGRGGARRRRRRRAPPTSRCSRSRSRSRGGRSAPPRRRSTPSTSGPPATAWCCVGRRTPSRGASSRSGTPSGRA